MSRASVDLEMRLKDNRVQVGLDALAAKEEKSDKGFQNIAKSAKQADAELNKFAKRTTEINSTPLEKYNRQVFVLDEALKRHKITVDTHARAVGRARSELEGVGRAQQSAWGGDALGQVKALAGTYFTLQTAVRLVGDAFRYARQESKDALGSLRGLNDTRRNLAQLTLGEEPGALDKWQKRIDAAAIKSGVKRDVAQKVFFEAKSFGFDDQFEQIMEMDKGFSAETGARLAGKVNRMFGGKLRPEQIGNMALTAGQFSEANVEQFADAAATAMEGGLRINTTPEELFAILGQGAAYVAARGGGGMGEGGGAVRTFGHRFSALAQKIAFRAPEEMKHGGLLAAYDKMAADPEAMEEIVKDNEEVAAMVEIMKNIRPQLGTALAAQKAARDAEPGKGPLAEVVRNAENDPKSRAARAVQSAENVKEVAREDHLAEAEAGRTVATSRVQARLHRERAGVGERYGAKLAGDLAEGAQMSPGATWAAGRLGGGFGRIADAANLFGLLPAFLEYLGRTARAVEAIRDGGDGGGGSSRPAMAEATSSLN